MVAFDGAGISGTAFDHIRINGTLHKNVNISQLPGFFLKDTNEFFSNDLTFLLRFRNVFQFFQKAVLCIDTNQIHVKLPTENTFYPVAFLFPKQTMIHKDTGQTISDCFVEQNCGNGTVHAAAECAENFLAGKRTLISGNASLDEVLKVPASAALTDIKQKVVQDLFSICCMGYFRMKLYTVQLTAFITHGGTGTLICMCNDTETTGNLGNIVGMAHPAEGGMGNSLKQSAFFAVQCSFSVFTAALCTADLTVSHKCHQLITIADSKNRDSQIQNGRIIVRRHFVVDTIGAAGKNNALVSGFLDLGY